MPQFTLSPLRSCRTAAAGAMLLAWAALLPACVGYNVYPKQEGVNAGFTNPNSDPFPPIMAEAVRWVITRYPAVAPAEWSPPLGVPPEGSRFAVNLPVGVNRMVYLRTVERIGYGAVPLEHATEGLPTYHISRIWISGDEAKVDVVRPVFGLPPAANGRPVTQGITVRLRGGMEPWHVTSHRTWSINTLATPELNYVPEEGAATPRPKTVDANGESAGPSNLPE